MIQERELFILLILSLQLFALNIINTLQSARVECDQHPDENKGECFRCINNSLVFLSIAGQRPKNVKNLIKFNAPPTSLIRVEGLTVN